MLKRFQFRSLNYIAARAFTVDHNNDPLRVYISKNNEIQFNLAAEEFLYNDAGLKAPTLFLYQNDKTVIMGRHQNPWKECHIQAMNRDGINLCRRKSGGGCVYQDLGNTCFSFLTPVFDERPPLNVKEDNNKILISAFHKLGIPAEVSGRNDLIVHGKKFSGSAYQVALGKKDGSGKKALHHGTMMINVDVNAIQKYLNPNKEKLKSKGIDSVVSRVQNLIELVPDLTHEKVINQIIDEFLEFHGRRKHVIEEINKEEVIERNPIVKKTYEELKSWDWTYQSTPQFTNNMETRFIWGIIDLYVQVEKSVITEGKVFSDCLFPEFIESMNTILNSDKIIYDEAGMKKFAEKLRQIHSTNKTLLGYIDELQAWLLKAI